MPLLRLLAVLAMALILTGPAVAADWVVMRLRGAVEIQIDSTWVALKRGDVVANEQLVRTLATGHVELQRNLEIVTLGANTEVRIATEAETGYTTVLQDFGRVEVDAEAKRVKHLEVKTPYLAAVVKGTHFIVTSDADGAAVMVERGAVQVQSASSERTTTIRVGQTATVKRKSDLVVGGLGPWPAIIEPGVTRTAIVASLGGALPAVATRTDDGAVPALTDLRSTIAPPPSINRPAGGVSLVASTSTAMFGLAASPTGTARASEQSAEPVSLGIVLFGALLGAALGGLALLLRRAI